MKVDFPFHLATSESGSSTAPHFAGDDLASALRRAEEQLGPVRDLSHLAATQQLAWHILDDAARLARTVPPMVAAMEGQGKPSAEPIETITRKVIEHAIFLEYLQDNRDNDDLVSEFLKACQVGLERLSAQDHKNRPKLPSWPHYRDMASSYEQLYRFYNRYSHLAHPKTCIPYSYSEATSGLSPNAYFLQRAQHAVADLTLILHLALDNMWIIGVPLADGKGKTDVKEAA